MEMTTHNKRLVGGAGNENENAQDTSWGADKNKKDQQNNSWGNENNKANDFSWGADKTEPDAKAGSTDPVTLQTFRLKSSIPIYLRQLQAQAIKSRLRQIQNLRQLQR